MRYDYEIVGFDSNGLSNGNLDKSKPYQMKLRIRSLYIEVNH